MRVAIRSLILVLCLASMGAARDDVIDRGLQWAGDFGRGVFTIDPSTGSVTTAPMTVFDVTRQVEQSQSLEAQRCHSNGGWPMPKIEI